MYVLSLSLFRACYGFIFGGKNSLLKTLLESMLDLHQMVAMRDVPYCANGNLGNLGNTYSFDPLLQVDEKCIWAQYALIFYYGIVLDACSNYMGK